MMKILLQARLVLSVFERVSFNLTLISICCCMKWLPCTIMNGEESFLEDFPFRKLSLSLSLSSSLYFLPLSLILRPKNKPSKSALSICNFLRWIETALNHQIKSTEESY